MKNISEIKETIEILNNQYDEMKIRYDNHAGFRIRLQNNKSSFVDLSKIINTRICCSDDSIEISTYPFYHTSDFARCIHVRCKNCGTTWVPYLDFDLNKYYEIEYAKHVQPFRLTNGLFYSTKNSFWNTKTAITMKARAQEHISYLNIKDNAKLLEIGPGVGIALSLAPENCKKFASELDVSCQKILKEELGVNLIDFENTSEKLFNGILISHVIEHLEINQIIKLKNGERNKILFEPHIISFSAFGLTKILEKCGFHVCKLSIDDSLKSMNKLNQKYLLKKEIVKSSDLICVLEKNIK